MKKTTSAERHRLINERLASIGQWQTDHAQADSLAFKELGTKFDMLDSNLSLLPDEEKIEEIVRKVMLEVLFSTGRWTKGIIITGAAIVVSLGVFTGAWKIVLAWIGLSKM